MAATPASRNHHAKQHQPYPLPTDPSKHVRRRLTASIRTAASHLRLLFLSPVCELHRRRPPVVSPHPCAPSRRSAPPSASCDDTPLERPPPAPSPGRATQPTGRRCATPHQRRWGAPWPRNSARPPPATSLMALHPRALLQQRRQRVRPRPPPAGAGRHQAPSAVAQ